MDIGPLEAETFWTAFLRKLARRSRRGAKLVVSDGASRPSSPRCSTPVGSVAETDVLAQMTSPPQHRTKLHSIERSTGEIKRRTEVVGIFPNEDAMVRLIGAIPAEQNDEWALQRARYMTVTTYGDGAATFGGCSRSSACAR